MAHISKHAADRAKARIGGKACKNLPALFESMWGQGRDPTDGDFQQFGVVRKTGFEYRITLHRRHMFLVVKGPNDTFVTVIRR